MQLYMSIYKKYVRRMLAQEIQNAQISKKSEYVWYKCIALIQYVMLHYSNTKCFAILD